MNSDFDGMPAHTPSFKVAVTNACSRSVRFKAVVPDIPEVAACAEYDGDDRNGFVCTTAWTDVAPGQTFEVANKVNLVGWNWWLYSAYVPGNGTRPPAWLSVPGMPSPGTKMASYVISGNLVGLGGGDDVHRDCDAAALPDCVWWALVRLGAACAVLAAAQQHRRCWRCGEVPRPPRCTAAPGR